MPTSQSGSWVITYDRTPKGKTQVPCFRVPRPVFWTELFGGLLAGAVLTLTLALAKLLSDRSKEKVCTDGPEDATKAKCTCRLKKTRVVVWAGQQPAGDAHQDSLGQPEQVVKCRKMSLLVGIGAALSPLLLRYSPVPLPEPHRHLFTIRQLKSHYPAQQGASRALPSLGSN